MGKYSIENYEQYRTIKCRPRENLTPAAGAGFSFFATADINPEDRPEITEKAMLRIHVRPAESTAETEAAIQTLASRYCQDPHVIGVTPAADMPFRPRMWEIISEAFSPRRFFVPVSDGDMIHYALKQGFFGGLLAEVKDSPLDVCEAFARNGAQRLYERYPVLVRFTKPEKADGRYALQWHANAVEGVQEQAGPRIALRRLTYPSALTSGGFAPMRFWWTNRGPSPMYERTEVRLRFVRNGKNVATVLPGDCPERIQLADRVFNRIVRLPELPEGQYRLEYGLFLENGTPVTLSNANAVRDGYYEGDVINIDHVPRPEMETIWDTYSPDGYYPLEDPKVPGV